MSKSKFLIVFTLIFLLSASSINAFQQDYTPEDSNWVYQTYFNLINIEPSWSNDLQVNKEVVVAVLDSGVDLDHPDLSDNFWVNIGEIPDDGLDNDGNSYIDDVNGWDFIDSDSDPEPDLGEEYNFTAINHGTVIAGVIAAVANTSGIVGIAPQAKIMPLKILNNKGQGNVLVLSQAIDYAVENGADIINLSLVGEAYNEDLKESIVNAYNNGVMIIAASGNEDASGVNLDIDLRYPVCDIDHVNRVFGVSAIDKDKAMASFSNYGEECIDISAPGDNFYSTVYQNTNYPDFSRYYSGGWSGTSVATPIISATAALLKMNYPDLRPYDIYSILSASAQSLADTNPLHHIDLGAGLIDIGGALNLAKDYYTNSIKIILAPESGLAPKVSILDEDGNFKSSFMAYSEKFYGGVNIAVGDVNNDGKDEIVTAPMTGGGPHIRVFDTYGNLLSEFFAYGADFFGGVNVAIGDIDGDGKDEIVTAPMFNGGPHVRGFTDKGRVKFQFFAYDKEFHGGVNLAIGDMNNDGKDDIITAPASNCRPEIKVFDYRQRIKSKFLAFDSDKTSGVEVSVGDVNSDGWEEIIATPTKNASPTIRLFSMKGRQKGEFMAHSQYLTSGVKVLARDISSDRLPEILTLPNKRSAALLKIYDYKGLEKDSFYLSDVWDRNGYNFEVLFN